MTWPTDKRRRQIREALERLRDWQWGTARIPAKRFEARKALERIYAATRKQLRETGNYDPMSCVCKLDRVVLTTTLKPASWFNAIPGYQLGRRRNLWHSKHLYRWAQPFSGTGSVREVVVEFEPKKRWLPAYRITVIPVDATGLEPEDLELILAQLQTFKLVLTEIAWDFATSSRVDVAYVRQFGLFGKTWLPPGTNPLHDKWGSAKGIKVVRSYYKLETGQHRIELELHSRFLRKHGIEDIQALRQLETILPGKHIFFAELDGEKLVQHLQLSGFERRKIVDILAQVEEKGESLWETLRYLRRRVHLTNVRRFLTPLDETNTAVREAIEKWAAKWAKYAKRQGRSHA